MCGLDYIDSIYNNRPTKGHPKANTTFTPSEIQDGMMKLTDCLFANNKI